MADEITASTIQHIVNSEWIQPAFQDYAHDWVVATQFLKPYDLRGKGTASVAVPSLTSQMGTVSDGGASVDLEFDATDGTTLSNTALALSQATLSAAEFGISREITDNALEDHVSGFELIGAIANDNARILTTALEDDVVALFTSITNNVGSSGSDMTLANLDSAIVGIGRRGVRAPDGLVGVLDDEQRDNFEAAVTSTGSSMAVYDNSADRFMAIARDQNNGLTDARFSSYKGVSLYSSGLTDTANTAADVVGCVFVPWTSGNDRMCAFAIAWSRMLRVTTERDEKLRSTSIVTTQRAGVAELLDVAAVSVTTDAP